MESYKSEEDDKNEIVTIALHCGKKDYYPLVENFLKSLLTCVTYPNIELMLIESAGNTEIIRWFEQLDFEDYFINFLGSKSRIIKNKGVKIAKNVKIYTYPKNYKWFQCYLESIQNAIKDASGKYFCFFAEDNQFTVKGDIISDYIKIMKNENNFKSFVHFFGQQKYKLFKQNNYFKRHSKNFEGIEYFKPQHKWDFWSLTLTENYRHIGDLAQSIIEVEKPHNTVIDYSNRTKEMGYVRVYPKIPHGIWFHNNDRKKIIDKITKNSHNPDYVYYQIFDKNEMINKMKDQTIPLSTDDFTDWVC